MLHRTFWTWRRFTGIVLILGGILFLGSAWIPLTIGPPAPLTDSKGTFIYSLPPQAMLGVVYHHQALWWWTNAFFMGSTLVHFGHAHDKAKTEVKESKSDERSRRATPDMDERARTEKGVYPG